MSDSMEAPDLGRLSPYELRAWESIQDWKDSPARRRLVLPESARQRAQQFGHDVAEVWNELPGTSQVQSVLDSAMTGGSQLVADAVTASLMRDRILEAVRRTGATADELSDLSNLDLQVLDCVCPRLNVRYAAASAATGAGSGFVAGGGSAAIVGTGGVAAAPGALAVAGALAGDVVATIAMAARVVAHYAGYYGFDAREEEETAVLLAVIGVGVVGEGAAKQTAMFQVRQAAMLVARRAAWKELSEETIVKLIQGLFAKLSVNLTKQKLGQALPVAGIALGAGFNYGFVRRVGTAASFAYRERFLIEKYGLDDGMATPELADVIDVESIGIDASPGKGADGPPS